MIERINERMFIVSRIQTKIAFLSAYSHFSHTRAILFEYA